MPVYLINVLTTICQQFFVVPLSFNQHDKCKFKYKSVWGLQKYFLNKTNLDLGSSTTERRSRSGNQSWSSLATHSSMSFSAFRMIYFYDVKRGVIM